MKLSCLPVSFFSEILSGKMHLLNWVSMGKELMLDAVDISILFIEDHVLKEVHTLRQQIEDSGMQILMVTTYPDFTHPVANQRKKEVALEIEAIEKAAAIGAKYVRVTAGQAHPETQRDQGVDWAIQNLISLVEKTRSIPIQLVYENHAKPGVWQYTDFSQPPEIFLDIARAIKPSGIRVNFDTGNAAAFANDPVGLLKDVIDMVETIHASDTTDKGILNHTLLGTGCTPFPGYFKTLKQAGWDGWICMEEASNMGKFGIQKAATFIRQTWQRTS